VHCYELLISEALKNYTYCGVTFNSDFITNSTAESCSEMIFRNQDSVDRTYVWFVLFILLSVLLS